MSNVKKAGNDVISLVFYAFLAGILAVNLSAQVNNSSFNFIEQNLGIINVVFVVLFLSILMMVFKQTK